MSTSPGADPSSSPADETVTSGFGGPVTAQDGSVPSTENQRETGGSGGDGLTRNDATEDDAEQDKVEPARPVHAQSIGESGARGFQDTRGEQAGGTETGLGAPDSGANQVPADLEHKHKR
ncbi:MAG TPA: hypothetical protein VF861_14285 [Telluria sp.]